MTSQGSLARGAALITIATAVSRLTGFVRVIVVAAAMGTTFLANTYQTANTAPNVVFELVAAGVLTSIFVPTFVGYLVKGQEEEGWDAANALASVALVALVALSLFVAALAPWIMRLLTIGVTDPQLRSEEVALGATFLRLFAPQIAFYGAGMIMTGALHAHRRFALPAIAPILNNVVVIGVYLAYAAMRGGRDPSVSGITDAEVFLLGAGTTAGVIAMTVCLVPQLARLGWRARFNFDLSHPAVRRGARLGVWALGYAGGYQAGLIVVLLLANKVEGGVAAYQWAYTFFYLPHALFAIPVFHVLFTAMSEHIARDESAQFMGRLRDGLGMLAFLLLPLSAFLLVVADGLTQLTLQYGVMTEAGADQVAIVLIAFVVGLPTYSAFLVYTRAFYAFGEVKIPALVNAASVAASSVFGALFFLLLPDRAAVAGLALGHSLGFALGSLLISRAFARRWSSPRDALGRSVRRTFVVTLVALGAMAAVDAIVPDSSKLTLVANLLAVGAAGAAVYLGGMKLARAPELSRLRSLLPGTAA